MIVINKRYVENCPVSELRPHPRNPRHGDVGAIHTSILRLGFFGALIAQESTGYILVGNHRYQAALLDGTDELPVIFVDVDDEAALAILLADNRTGDLASYNDLLLLELLDEARNQGNLEATGYDEDAMQLIMEDQKRSFLGAGPTAPVTRAAQAAAENPAAPGSAPGSAPASAPAASGSAGEAEPGTTAATASADASAAEPASATTPPVTELPPGPEPKAVLGRYQEQYAVIVVCENELHQREVFDDLTVQGYQVKVVCT